jgi:hypothetical protein
VIDWAEQLEAIAPAVLSGTVLRLVESQEQVATNQLVGSLARQAVLEALLEQTKPPLRKGTQRLHYLLATPFRYPPLKHGSRFGRRSEPSLFYGSQQSSTVLAEAAYYRFVFWHGMAVPPPRKLDTQHTLFGAAYRTGKGLRLQASPFDAYRQKLTHPSDYCATQSLGSSMREVGVEAFEFVSARDPDGGLNVALFNPAALAGSEPSFQQAWLCELTGVCVRFHTARIGQVFEFAVESFQVDGVLPWPASN